MKEWFAGGATVEYSVSAAQDYAAGSGNLPRESDAWLQAVLPFILDGGVVAGTDYSLRNRATGEIRCHNKTIEAPAVGRVRIRARWIEGRCPAKILSQLTLAFVAETQIQRQPRKNPVVILDEAIPLPDAPISIKYAENINAEIRIPQQEIRHAGEHQPPKKMKFPEIDLGAVDTTAKMQRMLAPVVGQ